MGNLKDTKAFLVKQFSEEQSNFLFMIYNGKT